MKTIMISPTQAQEVLKRFHASGRPYKVVDMIKVSRIKGDTTSTALLSTGAKLYRVKSYNKVQYYLSGYSQDGSDVTTIYNVLEVE